MPRKRDKVRSGCPIACTLDVVGDRWTLLILRDLIFFNRHEFREMANAEEGIASNILTDRLKKLGEGGLITSVPHPTNKTRKLYFVTEKGKSIIPLMTEFVLWGNDQIAETEAPEDIIQFIRSQREVFYLQTLDSLAKWEVANLPGRVTQEPSSRRDANGR
jgi:DNA-binding HxlR family transcriptional regulator